MNDLRYIRERNETERMRRISGQVPLRAFGVKMKSFVCTICLAGFELRTNQVLYCAACRKVINKYKGEDRNNAITALKGACGSGVISGGEKAQKVIARRFGDKFDGKLDFGGLK